MMKEASISSTQKTIFQWPSSIGFVSRTHFPIVYYELDSNGNIHAGIISDTCPYISSDTKTEVVCYSNLSLTLSFIPVYFISISPMK